MPLKSTSAYLCLRLSLHECGCQRKCFRARARSFGLGHFRRFDFDMRRLAPAMRCPGCTIYAHRGMQPCGISTHLLNCGRSWQKRTRTTASLTNQAREQTVNVMLRQIEQRRLCDDLAAQYMPRQACSLACGNSTRLLDCGRSWQKRKRTIEPLTNQAREQTLNVM